MMQVHGKKKKTNVFHVNAHLYESLVIIRYSLL